MGGTRQVVLHIESGMLRSFGCVWGGLQLHKSRGASVETIKKKRDPLCFIEIVDVPLGTDPELIEQRVEEAYSELQDACENGHFVAISSQQTVHTYSKLLEGTGDRDPINRIEEHLVFVLTVHIISQDELQRRQRLSQLGGNHSGPRG